MFLYCKWQGDPVSCKKYGKQNIFTNIYICFLGLSNGLNSKVNYRDIYFPVEIISPLLRRLNLPLPISLPFNEKKGHLKGIIEKKLSLFSNHHIILLQSSNHHIHHSTFTVKTRKTDVGFCCSFNTKDLSAGFAKVGNRDTLHKVE